MNGNDQEVWTDMRPVSVRKQMENVNRIPDATCGSKASSADVNGKAPCPGLAERCHR